MNKIVALVGMPGAGKTEVSKILQSKGFASLRFGQVVLDEALRRGRVDEATEREIRNGLRKKFGQGALALLNLQRIDELVLAGKVVIDDLYSWDEYKILKEKYGPEGVSVVAVCASPKVRYRRLISRKFDRQKDPRAFYRPLTLSEAKGRDFDQIEQADQGGPIALADFYVVNEGTVAELKTAVEKLLTRLRS